MKLLAASIAWLCYGFLYLPLLVILLGSFNASRHGAAWSGFTLRWYQSVLTDAQVLSAIKNTLAVGAISTLGSTVLGTMLAYGLARHHFRGRKWIANALLVPIAVPDIVMAAGLMLVFALVRQWSGIGQPGLCAMIVGHTTFQIPFVTLVVAARMRGLDWNLFEAASDLGASSWQRFTRITLPLLRPGIISGALLAFTLSLDDFVVSFFLSGAGSTTLPIYIYSAVKRGVTAEIHALSVSLMFAAMLAALVVTLSAPRTPPRESR